MGIGQLLAGFVQLYMLIIFVWIISSWIPQFRQYTFVRFCGELSEPFLRIFRGVIPPIGGMLDISPIIAFLVLQLLTGILLKLPM